MRVLSYLCAATRRLLTPSAIRPVQPCVATKIPQTRSIVSIIQQRYPSLASSSIPQTPPTQAATSELVSRILCLDKPIQVQPSRTRVYYSWKKGKPKTIHAVVNRFKRLENGLWIRTRAGRRKRLWKKKASRKIRMRGHVLCNKRQSWLLERMVCAYWKRPRHYPNDPYAPYHVRNNFHNDIVYKKAPFYP